MLVFVLDSKQILNSNSLPNNRFVKGSMAKRLRAEGQAVGVEEHDSPGEAQKLLDANKARAEITSLKAKKHKALKKDGYSAEEIEESLNKIEKNFIEPEQPTDFKYMHRRFSVSVIVCPPTRRKIDPANLYPTIKPIIDGLTDSGWWEDDNYNFLQEISFRYGGVSGEKGKFHIKLDIKEIGEE